MNDSDTKQDTPDTGRKHTPIPWYEAGRCTNAAMIASENDPKGLDIALVYDHCDGYEGNIDLIVRACNSHYKLLETLRGCVSLIEILTEGMDVTGDKELAAADAAIADASK